MERGRGSGDWVKEEKGRERGKTKEREGDVAGRTEGIAEQMATEETAGGARKATKSKLFEFLVHGVVSSGVRHRHTEDSCAACVCMCVCVCRSCVRACVCVSARQQSECER